MEIFKLSRDLKIMEKAKLTIFMSIIMFAFSIGMLAFRGLNLSIDFTGGTLIEARFSQPADIDKIRHLLEKNNFAEASVQNFGSSKDVLVRLPVKSHDQKQAHLSNQVLSLLKTLDAQVALKRVEFVGPQVGNELLSDGVLALMVVSAGIMLYLAIRFEWRFAVGAMVATAHDILIILGLFSFFQWEFSLTVLAAVLSILGYSVNDTVVVFDRIRENFRKMRSNDVAEIMNNAISQTLSRTVMTSSVTQVMVLAMLFLGGDVLFYFALALTIGIVVGTYSSILVASPVVMWLGISRDDFVKNKERKVISGEVL